MKIVRSSFVRNNFQDVISEVYYTKKPVMVSKNGKPRVLITPIPESDPNIARAIAKHTKNTKKK